MKTPNSRAYRRLTGRLRLNGRSAVLETEEGDLLYLDTDDDLTAFEGSRVVVEGQLSRSGRMALTWLGAAA